MFYLFISNQRFVLLLLLLMQATWSSAISFTVSNNNDSGTGSLRQAILDANANATIDTIFLYPDTVHLLTQLPAITGNLLMIGHANGSVLNRAVSGGLFRHLEVSSGTCTFQNIELINGETGGVQSGGSIYIHAGATVVISGCTFAGNKAAGDGGAIANIGTLSLYNCTFFDNRVTGLTRGGALFNDAIIMALVHCTFSDNNGASSGTIRNNGTIVNMTNTIIANTVGAGTDMDNNGLIGVNNTNIVLSCAGTCPSFNTTNPNLEPLKKDLGNTRTMAISSSSAAYAAGTATTFTKDQRGIARSAVPDIGAYEAVPKLDLYRVGDTLNIAPDYLGKLTQDTLYSFTYRILNTGKDTLKITDVDTSKIVGCNIFFCPDSGGVNGITLPAHIPPGDSVSFVLNIMVKKALGLSSYIRQDVRIEHNDTLYLSTPTVFPVAYEGLKRSYEVQNIANGSTTIINDTDFGQVSICSDSVGRMINLINQGDLDISITSISSSNPAFSVSNPSTISSHLVNHTTAYLYIGYNPSTIGVDSGIITINSDSHDDPVYTFLVRGEAVRGYGDLSRDTALNLNGTVYVDLGDNMMPEDTTADWMIEGWIKTSATAQQAFVANYQEFHANKSAVFVNAVGAANKLSYWKDGLGNVVVSTTNVNDGAWHHVAITRASNQVSLYVDGILEDTGVDSLLIGDVDTYLGAAYSNSTPYRWVGMIDEVRIWHIARTASEIRENMHLTLPACQTGLFAYYQMNEGAGANILPNKASKTDAGVFTEGILAGPNFSTAWAVSGINAGQDNALTSQSQTITAVPTGASIQNFTNANLSMNLTQHSSNEDITVTHQLFTPNTTEGIVGAQIIDVPMWTVNKSSKTATLLTDYTFSFSGTPFSSATASKYRLYWRPMNGEGAWNKIAVAHSLTANTITFKDIRVTGQLMVVKDSEEFVSEVRGNMYNLDGVNDYIDLGINAGLSHTVAFTIETWVKRTTNGSGTIYSEGNTADDMPYFMIAANHATGGALEIVLQDATGTGLQVLATNGFIPENEWTHVAFVRTSPTTASLYINGVLEDNLAFVLPALGVANSIQLGARGRIAFDRFWQGSLEETRLWSAALTQSEIRDRMHLTLKGNEVNLLHYYQYNQDATGIGGVKDALGSNHGTAMHMALGAYTASEVPVAGGVSDRLSVTAAGNYVFQKSGVQIAFDAIHPNGELVVYRLETEAPHGANSINGDVDNEYFVARNFGANATFLPIPNIIFERINQINAADASLPQASSPFQLYKRSSNAYGATWGSTFGGAAAATASPNGSLTYDVNNGLTSFSQMVIVNTGTASILPVELLDFKAKRADRTTVALSWLVASEKDCLGYELERMLEGVTNFEKLMWIDANGSFDELAYSATDSDAGFETTAYYRLKQVDDNGKYTYSEIRAVEGIAKVGIVRFYPNPVRDVLTIELRDVRETVEVMIQGINGQLYESNTYDLSTQSLLRIENMENYPSGWLILSVITKEGMVYSEKIFKE